MAHICSRGIWDITLSVLVICLVILEFRSSLILPLKCGGVVFTDSKRWGVGGFVFIFLLTVNGLFQQ